MIDSPNPADVLFDDPGAPSDDTHQWTTLRSSREPAPPRERTVEQVLAELEMCSHVSAVNMNPSSRDAGEDIGGKRPPGGVDGREDRYRDPEAVKGEPERVLRSAQHFRQQLARGRPVSAVLRDAEASLDAWRRAARPKNPVKGDPLFKMWLVKSPLSAKELMDKYGVTRQYVSKVRIQYRDVS